jgi:beta-lactamase regulating signal transducer with metallopeptidase domain
MVETSVCMSILHLFYKYVYFKIAYFEWSRYFFFASLIVSITIPLLPNLLQMDTLRLDSLFGMNNLQGESTILVAEDTDFLNDTNKSILYRIPVIKILFIIWLSGTIRFLFLFAKNLISIKMLLKKHKNTRSGKYVIVHTDLSIAAFSFFNYIFLSSVSEKLSELEIKQIIEHEKKHAAEFHSLDNIVFELYRAFFWFNPVSKKILDDIKEIHEFIVDIDITDNRKNPDYSRLILKLSTRKNIFGTVSNFSKDEIKNRIELISAPDSQKIRKRRFSISIPVLILVIIAFYTTTSSINSFAGININNSTKFISPFAEGRYKLTSPFFMKKKPSEVFKNKKWNMNKDDRLLISHPENTYSVKSHSKVFAVSDCKVLKIDTADNWGLNEICISVSFENGITGIYKNLYEVKVKSGDIIKRGNIIGKTGDVRLYPTISFQLLENGKPVNPSLYF